MKHISSLLLGICLIVSNPISAQDSLHVTQSEKQMSLGIHNGFSVDIPQSKEKDVVNSWKKYIKRDTKSSVESNDGEYRISGTAITNISTQPMNVYATITEVDKSIRLTAYFTEDDSNFISTAANAEKATATEKLVRDFARTQYRLAVEDELNEETKKLEKLESIKEDLINDNEKAEKNIKEYERKIDRARDAIKVNSEEQSKRSPEVANQKEIVRITTPKTETYDLEEKKLNSLEKELKKLVKEGESLHSDIDDWNSDIRKEKRDIEKTDDDIKEKKNAISKQKDHVKDLRGLMERIK